MKKHRDLNLYLVAGGEAVPAAPDVEWDGFESVLVAATSAEAALRVAASYDRGEIGPDNLDYDGRTIVAVAEK